jgi:Leucine-rich repeat (LRR) protein/PKD repeat protein
MVTWPQRARHVLLVMATVAALSLSALVREATAAIPASERQVLIDLYNATGGASWTKSTDWRNASNTDFSDSGTECTWYGVTCDAGETAVKELVLDQNNLVGTLPSSLGNLTSLTRLNLYFNKLSGTIPTELGDLTHLTYLDLSYNRHLSSTIPAQLGNLTQLAYLNLGLNQLSGSIPTQLTSLTSLTWLDLDDNELSGSIPTGLGDLTKLTYLVLAGNQLSGTIPTELGKLTDLTYLDLNGNPLSGSIPIELGNLTSLKTLHLSSNQLSGSIPTELGNLTSLQTLDLGGGQLTGTIPTSMGNLTNLRILALDDNQLSGSIPTELGNLTELDQLYLESNQLSGSIPTELGNLTKLRYLALESNQLSGAIPTSLENLTALLDGLSTIKWNALYSTDPTLTTFLNEKQYGGDWESTQTVPPAGVAVDAITANAVTLSWTPITYTGDTGDYKAYYSTSSSGPFIAKAITSSKSASSVIASGLNSNTTYYFVIRTVTNPHRYNQNTVTSGPSTEVYAATNADCTRTSITSQPQGQSIQKGQTVTLSVAATGTASLSYQWYQGSSGVTSAPVGTNASSFTTPALTATTSYWVRVSNSCGHADSATATVTVQTNCTAPAKPTANFNYSPARPHIGDAVQFADTSTSGPTSWAWSFGDGTGSASENPTHTYTQPGSFTAALTTTNCKGSTQTQQSVVVLPPCSQSAVPAASFNLAPTGALVGFPEQQQPYAGQAVTFTDTSNNSPDAWQWCDFGELGVSCSTPITTQNPTVTWATAGGRNVRLLAHNCVGWSPAQAVNSVMVYQDVRHVVADFSWLPYPPQSGGTTTFTAAQGAANGDPDTFVWTLDDANGTFNGAELFHAFTCGGTHKLTLTSSRSNYPSGAQTVTKTVPVDGTLCGPTAVMTVDNAKVTGLNGTSWQTDVRFFNPANTPASITLQFLPVNANNAAPISVGPLPIPAKGTLVVNDILGWVTSVVGTNLNKTALRVTFANDQNVAPVIVSRTYTPSPGGGTYGQYAPGVGVIPGNPPASTTWITGLHNNGTTTGYRSNYSLLNLQGDAGVNPIAMTLYDVNGKPLKTVTQGLLQYGYIQDSIKNLFGSDYANIGTFSLKIDVPAGASVQAYGSVADNLTGAPVLIPAGPPPPSMIYLPAVAHLNGKNGTVWRSDMQLTNTDSVWHTWLVTYVPKSSDPVGPTPMSLTLGPQQSQYMGDAINWILNNLLPDATATSGVIKIAPPTDGSGILPVVQARTFNQTANGTFGQNIFAFSAELGAAPGSTATRLLLTGMATADIARTSVGLVNLSETSPVYYQVYFYGETGNLLNPLDGSNNPIPYTFDLLPGGWDQDFLENRFKNAFGVALPSGLRVVSAEIFVTGGGPGSAYATVTDNITGDPTFIPAQVAP